MRDNDVQKYIFNNNQAIVNLVSTFKIRGFFWNKLFKKDIFNEIKFPEGIYYEGTYLMHIILGKINKIVVLPSAKYYYYYFKESVTKIKTPEKQLDYVNNLIKRYNDLYREYEELIPKMRKEILTEEQLREALESGWYDFNELVPLNIYRDIYYYIDELRKYKTDDEIWDFIKPFYTDLIGKIIIEVDRDYLYTKENEKNIYIRRYIKE